MDNTSVLPRLWWALLAWLLLLPSGPVAAASGLVVQHIGDLSGTIAEAVAEDAVAAGVTIVPFSPRIDARATPIILSPQAAHLARDGKRLMGLRGVERRSIRQAYDAGQVILLLEASTHDIEELHVLVEEGVTYESTTDPIVLAYALRQENDIPTARVVTYPVGDDLDGEGFDEDELESQSEALEIVLEELTLQPAVGLAAALDTASWTDWASSPVQSFILTSTDRGTYNTPVEIYALHSCAQNKDYYLVNTGGSWTPTAARAESASKKARQIHSYEGGRRLTVDWQNNRDYCEGGHWVCKVLGVCDIGGDSRACRYDNYPLFYQVDIVPPSGPQVVQIHAAPAGDQGQSTSYTSGFSFSIGGGVDVSGSGSSGGFNAGVSWDNSVSTTVPALAIEAGNRGNQGTFTRYRYCTVGSKAQDCTSTIQMTAPQGDICQAYILGQPQQGQTPNGRLSNVAQTVNWQVDPATYTGSTFDITVTFEAALATSTSKLWDDFNPLQGPKGHCNPFGCSCGIDTDSSRPVKLSHTFKVPLPSKECRPPSG